MTATKRKPTPKKPAAPKPQPTAQPAQDTERWHILYLPLWRSQLDFGIATGLENAKAYLVRQITDAVGASWEWRKDNPDNAPVIRLEWERVSDTEYAANGTDGIIESRLCIAWLRKVE